MDFEQPFGDVNSIIGVNADQMGVEGRVMELRQRQTVRDDRLPQLLMRIHYDVRSIEQPGFRQVRNRTPSPISREHRIPEGCLMQPSFDFTKRIPALGRVRVVRLGLRPLRVVPACRFRFLWPQAVPVRLKYSPIHLAHLRAELIAQELQ